MLNQIFAYIVHKGGVPAEPAAELLAAAQQLSPGQPPIAVVTGWGPDLDTASETLRKSFGEVWKVGNEALAFPNAELIRQVLVAILPPGCLLLVVHDSFGVDLSPGLSIKMNGAFVSDVVGIDGVEDGVLKVVRQEFGGQVNAHVSCDLSSGAVINLRPGAFRPLERPAINGTVIDKSSAAVGLKTRRLYLETVAAETGDVDISKQPVLVSIGRGIQDQENVAMAEELAEALGGAVSCSRPVADAKWLEKSRQVGSSGQTVKPKVYLACGISGSFQHMAGVQGNPLIVAINKNPQAPIFRVADVGIVDDILEFLPELTNRVREHAPLAMKKGGGR